MKLKNFTKFSAGIALISALPVGVVLSNPHTHTHSSLVVENKSASEIAWTIDDNGNISPVYKSQISGEITIPVKVNVAGVDKPVTGIANNAFSGCIQLTSINIPSGVTSIGDNAFADCSSLTNITFAEGSKLTSIGTQAFSKCALTSINIPDSVTTINDGVFNECKSLKTIDIPSGVTSIGLWAFQNCSSLTSVNFAEGSQLTSIAIGTFFDCSSLKTINIPNSVTSIGYNAFWNCGSLTSINIPSSVTTIGNSSFSGCSSLISINIPNSVTSIGDRAFLFCYSLKNITIPNSVTSIGALAFKDCSALTSINIPSSVTNIGNSAFENCGDLSNVYLSWDENQIKKLKITGCVFDSTSGQIKINFHIPKGMKELYIAQTKDWFDGSAVPNWIEDNPPVPSSNSNLALILGLTFGFIILIGIGSYLGYRYYKHRKNSKK